MTANTIPPLLNVQVTITRTPDGSGNTPDGNYNVVCVPEELTVTESNTIITYQLVAPTPHKILFTGMTVDNDSPIPQFSPASVALDGKIMMTCDLNSVPVTSDITLEFVDESRRSKFDPQVHNTPG